MRILAVDDERPALHALEKAVREAAPSAEVVCCLDPDEALEAARAEPFDAAFLDVETGSIGGIELARRLKDVDARTDIVFATAYSQYAVEAFSLHASGYVLKPVSSEDVACELENLRAAPQPPACSRVAVKTFGNFEVLCDGRPVTFSRSKAKELMAYLVHKRGSSCAVRELASVLFEDRPYTLSVQRQMQTIIAAMMKALRAVGAEHVVVKNYNSLSVDVDAIDCDYYRFLAGDASAVNAYTGEYLANYSWAEFVVGYLDRKAR